MSWGTEILIIAVVTAFVAVNFLARWRQWRTPLARGADPEPELKQRGFEVIVRDKRT